MLFLYSLFTHIAFFFLNIVALFNRKMKLFVQGRKHVFDTLQQSISAADKVIWFHAASLGEYEQGLPIMEKMRELHPAHKILLTFFSPSGYEIRKNTPAADVVVYLPMDTLGNARKFLKLAHPDMAFFIKYEFWPNYLNGLKAANVPTYLISGLFRPNQAFFKWYGGIYREAFKAFTHFFVQYESSKGLLKSIGFTNVSVSGDTRYDRVSRILEQNNTLPFIEEFIDDKTTIVFGSSWPKDESLFVPYINQSNGVKFVIAPHTFGESHIQELLTSLKKPALLYTEKEGKNLRDYDVLIINTIGLLGKIYSYADAAYVGGGFGTAGLHNILEPAAFGVPVVIGPNHTKFPEAVALAHAGGVIVVHNEEQMTNTLHDLVTNEVYRHETGHIAGSFVSMSRGAVNVIMKRLGVEG
ncbi:3-deoxy-D-manno-octulosonic acid transferase [Flavobacterium akiainvivens]|uniref:3-deoxy-D-manno-octulosonic acid transferase n=1 Tax=Flavobacterium akiainvivens TaxID=1202724 RepID=A0A0M8MBC5_9FLAO|nr:glycosyltransferase N-terminal domain-containing protein [Flavobacterium akiainvivens]KOS06545.1 3-deoxy-D-manno-octulosonic acid transferase [Flavobacterium akiainvivens]SFQ10898.1 3-deoxy-D-manno-octulosonic-acid transferase [Flavobacterium akiainvivens]